jgi:RND family efflux transporter MFP subunit
MIDIKTIKEKVRGKVNSLDRKTLSLISIAATVAVLGAGYMIFGKENGYAGVAKAEAPLTVSAITVEPRVIDTVVTAAGALSSKNTSVLSSKVMGKVIYLGVREGDRVAAGKLLVKIESGEISAQAYQAQAAYNNARLQYNRIKGLYDEKASTQMEMDLATLGLETAEAGLKAAKAMESYTIITAPINGQIMEKRINLGEMALPGQPILRIEDNRNLRLEVTVQEQDILSIQPGKAVRVQIDAMPGKDITGRVAQVVPASDVRTHSFLVKVDIPADKGLITGMYGKAFFETGKREGIVIPKTAVVDISGLSGVYIVSAGGNAVFQMIQLGEEREGSVEVLTGLKAGDKVVADNKLGRIEGRKIALAEK